MKNVIRRNRKVSKKFSVITNGSVSAVSIIAAGCVMAILNVLASSGNSQLLKSIGDKERKIKAIEEDITRENVRWVGMRTPDKVRMALFNNGLDMKAPRADQVVYMMSNGEPRPGQLSVARARQRNAAVTGHAKYEGGRRRR